MIELLFCCSHFFWNYINHKTFVLEQDFTLAVLGLQAISSKCGTRYKFLFCKILPMIFAQHGPNVSWCVSKMDQTSSHI